MSDPKFLPAQCPGCGSPWHRRSFRGAAPEEWQVSALYLCEGELTRDREGGFLHFKGCTVWDRKDDPWCVKQGLPAIPEDDAEAAIPPIALGRPLYLAELQRKTLAILVEMAIGGAFKPSLVLASPIWGHRPPTEEGLEILYMQLEELLK